jgi:hypothetical protein
VRALVDLLLSRDDGKFLLVKDPMKEILRWGCVGVQEG